MRTGLKLGAGALAVVGFVCAVGAAMGARETAGAAGTEQICTAPDARVMVDLGRHMLALCEKGKTVAAFSIRFGRGGIGKTKEGDGKTPVGVYPLGDPRPSSRYGTFIPIGYPTEEQRKQGYTGSAVGVHGPARWVKWLGSLVNTFDSSDGCVGLARDSEIDTIARWVSTDGVRIIELH